MSKELVTVKSFSNEFNAEIVKQQLETSGIKVFLVKDDLGGLYPQLQLTRGVHVKVAERDEEAAIEILQDTCENIPEIPSHPVDRENNDDEIISKLNELLRKSKAWVLIGLLIIPGWICHPVSLHYATGAWMMYKENNFTNIGLKQRIIRLLYISGILSILFWVLLCYLLFRKYS